MNATSGKFTHFEIGYDVPANPGMRETDIQTPCLLLDLDALERNIKKMGDYAKAHRIRHRAHWPLWRDHDEGRCRHRPRRPHTPRG
jgi:3-hydroxy-D-aspartate aldolase